MISKKGKRKLEYEGMVFYWFVRRNPDGIPRLHIMSEDKKVRLNEPLFDSEVPVASGYVRKVINSMCAIRPELYSFVLLCGTLMHTAIVALYDEEIIAPVYEGAEDEDMDSFSWDAAYTACMLYKSSFGQKDAVILYFRHSFWIWYINEAERLYKEFCV